MVLNSFFKPISNDSLLMSMPSYLRNKVKKMKNERE